MKLSTAFLGLLAFFSINTQFAQPGCVNGSCSALINPSAHQLSVIDAATTELFLLESNPHAQQQAQQEDDSDALGSLVLSTFFGKILQAFLQILQSPQNPKVVVNSLTNMVSGFATIAAKITKKSPDLTDEEYIEYLANLETNLRTCLRSIARAKRQHSLSSE